MHRTPTNRREEKPRGIKLALALACLFSYAARLPAQAPMHIPEVHGTTLAGKAVNLPGDLHGKATILLIGFTQDSRPAVTDWGKRLAGEFFASPTIAYFEMPVLESVPRLMRGFVLGRIKSTVSDRGRVTFLPLLDHEADWKTVAGYSPDKPGDAYILLVDEHAQVRWRTRGPLTDAAYTDLKTQLAALNSHRADAQPPH